MDGWSCGLLRERWLDEDGFGSDKNLFYGGGAEFYLHLADPLSLHGWYSYLDNENRPSIRIDDELDPIGAAASLRTAVGDGLLTYSLPVVPKTIDGNAVLLLGDGAESVLQYFRGRGPAPAPST